MKVWMFWIMVLVMSLGFGGPEAEAAKKWRLYENCMLIPNPANDGDSFHVKAGNKRHYLFRLYFADCPESDNSLPERVAEQAAYWNITPTDAVRMGKQAAKFTEDFLSKGFTVHSKLADAMGRSDKDRDYAVVMVGDKDLAVELVRNGLARIHGQPVDYPDGTPEKMIWWRMKSAEREAQTAKRGAWGVTATPANKWAARAPVPVPAPPPTTMPASVPSAAPASPAAPTRPSYINEQEVVLNNTIHVFSLKDATNQLGWLQAGAKVRALQVEPGGMIRIRFTKAGQVYEAQTPRDDIGL